MEWRVFAAVAQWQSTPPYKGWVASSSLARCIESFVISNLVAQDGRRASGLDLRKGVPMLVLSRQIGETIVIGEEIEVTVVDIRGPNVRIGITAPKSLPIDRAEIYRRKKSGIPGVVSPYHHDSAELDDVPAIIAEAKAFFISVDPAFSDPSASGSLANVMIDRLATLLSQERRKR